MTDTFDLAAFKKSYAANDATIEALWKTYDQEKYSMWKCTYDYAEDNESLEATKKFVTDFLKGSEALKDSLFAVVHIVGELEIEGLWLIKGADPEALFGANEDTSWFTWNQLGPDVTDGVKAAVGNVFNPSDNKVDGKEIKDTQVFTME